MCKFPMKRFHVFVAVVSLLLLIAVATTNGLQNKEQQQDQTKHPAPEPYSFSYTADSIGGSATHQESGDGSGRVTGFYTIMGEDGRERRVDYVADENGYRASVKTNEVGTRSQSSADAQYQVQLPSAKQLEAAKISLEEYQYLEQAHEIQRNQHSKIATDQRQQLQSNEQRQSGYLNSNRPAFVNNENYSSDNRATSVSGNSAYSAESNYSNDTNLPIDENNNWRSSAALRAQPSEKLTPLNPVVVQPSQVVTGNQIRIYPEIKNNPVWAPQQQQASMQQQQTSAQQTTRGSWIQKPKRQYTTVLQRQLEQQYKQQANSLANQDYPRASVPSEVDNVPEFNQQRANAYSEQANNQQLQATWTNQIQPQQQSDYAQYNQQQSNIINEQNEYSVNDNNQIQEIPQVPQQQQQQQQMKQIQQQQQQVSGQVQYIRPTLAPSTPRIPASTSTISPGLVNIDLNDSEEVNRATERPMSVLNLVSSTVGPIIEQNEVQQQQQLQQNIQQQQEFYSEPKPMVSIEVKRPQIVQQIQATTTTTERPREMRVEQFQPQRPNSVNQIIENYNRQTPGQVIEQQTTKSRQPITGPVMVATEAPELESTTTIAPAPIPSSTSTTTTTTTSTTTTTTPAPVVESTTQQQPRYIRPETTTPAPLITTTRNRQIENFFSVTNRPQTVKTGVKTVSGSQRIVTPPKLQPQPQQTFLPQIQPAAPATIRPIPERAQVEYSAYTTSAPATELPSLPTRRPVEQQQQQPWKGIKTNGKTSLPSGSTKFWQNQRPTERQLQQQPQQQQQQRQQQQANARVVRQLDQSKLAAATRSTGSLVDYASAFGFGIRSSGQSKSQRNNN